MAPVGASVGPALAVLVAVPPSLLLHKGPCTCSRLSSRITASPTFPNLEVSCPPPPGCSAWAISCWMKR